MLRLIGVAAAGVPMTDYNVELLPLSIGMHSRRALRRGSPLAITTVA